MDTKKNPRDHCASTVSHLVTKFQKQCSRFNELTPLLKIALKCTTGKLLATSCGRESPSWRLMASSCEPPWSASLSGLWSLSPSPTWPQAPSAPLSPQCLTVLYSSPHPTQPFPRSPLLARLPTFELFTLTSFHMIYPQTPLRCAISTTISLELVLWAQCLIHLFFLGVALGLLIFGWTFSPSHSIPVAHTHCVKNTNFTFFFPTPLFLWPVKIPFILFKHSSRSIL